MYIIGIKGIKNSNNLKVEVKSYHQDRKMYVKICPNNMGEILDVRNTRDDHLFGPPEKQPALNYIKALSKSSLISSVTFDDSTSIITSDGLNKEQLVEAANLISVALINWRHYMGENY